MYQPFKADQPLIENQPINDCHRHVRLESWPGVTDGIIAFCRDTEFDFSHFRIFSGKNESGRHPNHKRLLKPLKTKAEQMIRLSEITCMILESSPWRKMPLKFRRPWVRITKNFSSNRYTRLFSYQPSIEIGGTKLKGIVSFKQPAVFRSWPNTFPTIIY